MNPTVEPALIASLAQLGLEHETFNLGVAGSSPVRGLLGSITLPFFRCDRIAVNYEGLKIPSFGFVGSNPTRISQ
jgi:hypothetical protein